MLMFQPCVQIFRQHFTPVLNNKMYIVPPSFVETYLKSTTLYNFDHNFRFTAYTPLSVPSCFHMHPESPTLIRDMAKMQSATTAHSLRWLNVCLRLCGQKGTVEGTALNWWHSSGHYEADRRPALLHTGKHPECYSQKISDSFSGVRQECILAPGLLCPVVDWIMERTPCKDGVCLGEEFFTCPLRRQIKRRTGKAF